MVDERLQLRILVLFPLRYAASMAFAVEPISALAERGHVIDVLLSADADPPFQCDNPRINTFTFGGVPSRRGLRYVTFYRAACYLARKRVHNLIIGLSQMGLIVGDLVGRAHMVPCVFFNDEIWFGNERDSWLGNVFGQLTKVLERRANRNALFTVTQDPDRGQFLCQVNSIHASSLRYLPNSRRGGARICESDYAHQKFGFPTGTKIVLWLGGVTPGDGALELARLAEAWPDGYRMVFHLRAVRSSSQYVRAIRACHGRGQTYVSDRLVNYAEVDDLISSASVGLGLYADKGINARWIGKSSGKVNSYLKNGVPCVLRNFEGLRWVAEAGAGICINEVSEVLCAVERIVAEHNRFRQRSIEAFESCVNFDRSFLPIAEEIEKNTLLTKYP